MEVYSIPKVQNITKREYIIYITTKLTELIEYNKNRIQ